MAFYIKRLLTKVRELSNIYYPCLLFVGLCVISNACSIHRQITPHMFGAKADGKSDDHDAIQAALDRGGIIYFPAGVYRVSNTLHITKSNTHLILHDSAIVECFERTLGDSVYGNAGSTIVFKSKSAIKDPLNDGGRIYNVGIQGGIIRNRAPQNQKTPPFNNENAIGFTHCRNFYCKNVTIEYCNRKGITMQYYNDYGLIKNCKLKDCGVHGITIESSSNNIILEDNVIEMRKDALSKGENTNEGRNYGMHIIESENIKIINNKILSDCGVGLYSNNSTNMLLKGNDISSFSERAVVQIAPEGSNSHYIIEDNLLSGKEYSLYLSGSNSSSLFSLVGNTCESSILFSKGIIHLKTNIAPICRIDYPIESAQILGNRFYCINVTNASEDTRPICIDNILETTYKNWLPKIAKDKIKNK